MSNYTDEMVRDMVAHGEWSYAECCKFADEHGLKPRSVIAKVKSLQLAYTPKPARVRKSGEPVTPKATFAATIEQAVGLTLPSLSKMVRSDLVALSEALTNERTDG